MQDKIDRFVELVETTIRDGSYEVGFQFDRCDVITIASLLDSAGLKYIEVGHGFGLGVDLLDYYSRVNYCTFKDEHHLKSAREVVKNAKLGVLLDMVHHDWNGLESCVRMAAECGLDFIRLAFCTPIFDKKEAAATIGLAKELGLTVSVNYMRSYSVSPEVLAKKAILAESMGADWFYLVDSAGCWLPQDVQLYTEAVCNAVKCLVGFHGHNNLSFAVANSLAAMKAGASLLDCSLQGLGRATGNAQTEILLQILQSRYELKQEIDRVIVNALGRNFVRRYIRAGFDPTHVLAGASKLHSAVLKPIHECARQHELSIDAVLDRIGAAVEEAGLFDEKVVPNEIVDRACQEVKSRNYSDRLGAVATALSTPEPRAKNLVDFLKQQRITAFRDGLSTNLFIIHDRLWPFAEATVFRINGVAIACFPASTGIEIEEMSEYSWIDRVFVDEALLSGFLQEKHLTISFVDILAEAAAQGVRSSAIIAISYPDLKEAIRGRLWRCCQVIEADELKNLSGNHHYEHVLIEGLAGAQLLQELCAERLPAGSITVMGKTPMDIERIEDLVHQGWKIRVPDFAPLLAAQVLMSSEVQLVTSDSNGKLDPEKLLSLHNTSAIVDGRLITNETKEDLGVVTAFGTKPSTDGEVLKTIQQLRLEALFAGSLPLKVDKANKS